MFNQDYVKNVNKANRKGLTYRPELYELNDNLPRPVEFEDLHWRVQNNILENVELWREL